jgi:hypothetical protein
VATPLFPGFPAPPRGAVVFSRRLGSNALALGILPKPGGRMLLQASVLGPQGKGVNGLSIAFRLQEVRTAATPCGPGCYRTTLAPSDRPSSVQLELSGRTPTQWHVALPTAWPPRGAHTLLGRASRVWRSLHSLSFSDSLASGPRHATLSTWRVQAPDRVAYQVRDGWAGIIVGERRWDRPPRGSHWVASEQTRLTQPRPPWVSMTDAHLLGPTTAHGRPAWRISFFDPGTPGWFEVILDRRTMHTLELRMVATAHFMHDVYSSFNTTRAITRPR